MKKYYLTTLALTFLSGCYVCPMSDTDATDKYRIYRDAACVAVEPCDPEFMAKVKVYEADKDELSDICNAPEGVRGCYCGKKDCFTIVLAPEYVVTGTALHEYIHAAIDSAGIKSTEPDNEHDQFFWDSYTKAAELIENDLRSK